MDQEEQDKRIDYIEFPVTDLARAKAFYSSVFGWTFKDWGDDYTSFGDGRLEGGFRRADSAETGGPLVVVYAAALADVEKSVKDHGGVIVQETFEFPGGRRFHFKDPVGNVLGVWSDR